jgi:hypothetical protein
MAECKYCGREMAGKDGAHSCEYNRIKIGGKWYKRLKYQDLYSERCGDCNVKEGGYHHFGCDLEECPVCRTQLISCDCPIEEISISRGK